MYIDEQNKYHLHHKMSVSNKFTLSHISTLIKSAFLVKPSPPQLGRWGLHTKKNIVDLKVMYSNEDHCGICQEYITTKNTPKQSYNQPDEKKLYEEFIMLSSCSPDK